MGVRKERLGVVRAGGEYRAVATEPIATGELIAKIEGVLSKQPSRYTIQIGENEHVDLPPDASLEQIMDRHTWRFLNHSCDPNAVIKGRTLVAARPIGPLEEVTFNYNTTEYEMAVPFKCGCRSQGCNHREIRGFKGLSLAERERLFPFLAAHLVARMHDRAATV